MNNKKLNLEIDSLFQGIARKENSRNKRVIRDGVINEGNYRKAKFRILWILKEAYDPQLKNGENSDDWDFRKIINEKDSIYSFEGARNMYRKMTYISWGILNKFCKWDSMPDLNSNPEMLNALKSVSYINVNKFPGSTKSNDTELGTAYGKYEGLLRKQVDYCNPDIIIGGNTLKYFYKQFDISETKPNGSAAYYSTTQRLYIDAYHPSARLSSNSYCNDIIQIAERWSSENRSE